MFIITFLCKSFFVFYFFFVLFLIDMHFQTRTNGFMINRNSLEINKATFKKYLQGNTNDYVLPGAQTQNLYNQIWQMVYVLGLLLISSLA